MTVPTSIRRITPELHPVAQRLWQLYAHDLSQQRGTWPEPDGLYPAGRLPAYLQDPDRWGYLIHSGPALAGFALVRGRHQPRTLGEFFVVRAARRRRVGFEAARAVLGAHPGVWEIAFQEKNTGAARFWREVAEACGPWREEQRPVPGKPDVPPDIWIVLTCGA